MTARAPTFDDDRIIIRPGDIDLTRSPLRRLGEETYVLGAFNPGFTRLPNGNLLMMVRIAEALREPVRGRHVLAIRRSDNGYVADRHPLAGADTSDPRATQIRMDDGRSAMLLTSLSWLLPVELDRDGSRIVAWRYDRAIEPSASYQCYGVEDARISRVGDRWFMTTCSVSPERQCTALYTSVDAAAWRLEGIVLDHQNKDMLLFEGLVRGRHFALTRPTGDIYFAYEPDAGLRPGPSINLASSPDGVHWKPYDRPCLRPRVSSSAVKIGGGAPPIRTPQGWLVIYHGVERNQGVGAYRTFWALLDLDDPSRVIRIADGAPLLEARPDLAPDLEPLKYVRDVVYTSGAVADLSGDGLLLASGEDDLACRLTRVPLSHFAS